MKIKCPNCNAAYDMDESRVPAAGLNIKCPRCKNPFRVAKPDAEAPAAPAEAPVPLPAPQRGNAPPGGRPPGAMAPPGGPPPGAMRAPVGPPRPAPAAAPPADPNGQPPGWAASAHPAASGTQNPRVLPDLELETESEAPTPAPTPEAPTVFHHGTNAFSAAVAAVANRQQREEEPAPSFEVEEPPPEPEQQTYEEQQAYEQQQAYDEQQAYPPEEPGLDLNLPTEAEAPRGAFNLGDNDFTAPSVPPPTRDPGLDAAAAEADPFAVDFGAPPAPLQANNAAANALSMLDFEDGGQQAPVRWQVRRRSGKVFGPFDAPTIGAMLQQGQLFGNEDISTDGAQWTAIGDEPEFAKDIRPAAEGESKEPPGMAPAAPRIAAPVMPVMGASSIAPGPSSLHSQKSPIGKARVPVWARLVVRRLPILAAVAAIIAVVGGGVALGKFTTYGYFGVNLLKGKHHETTSPGAAKSLEAFSGHLSEGTFTGLQKALGAAQAAVTSDPESPEAVMDLAIVSSRLARRYGAPRTEVDRAKQLIEKLDPKGVEAKIASAAVKLADGKVPEAKSLLDPIAKDRRAELVLAEIFLQQKDFKGAAAQLDTILAVRPSGEAAMSRAEAARGLSDEPGERAALEKALEKVPGHPRARLWQARLDVAAGKMEEAEKTLTALLAPGEVKNLETTEEALGHHLLGDIHLSRKEISEASQEYTKAADQDPSNAKHRSAAAQILLRRHQWAEAVVAYDKALEKAPADVQLLTGSARALIETASFQKANSKVEEARKAAPKDPTVAVVAGDLQVALQHYGDAHKAYGEALKLDEKNVAALVAEGNLYLVEGKPEEAQHSIEKAVAADPNDASAQTAMGIYRLGADQPKEAREAFEAAIKLDADRIDSIAGLARALDALNENELAGDAFKKAVTLEPRSIPYRESYASFLRKTGDLDAALVQLKAGLGVDEKDARLQALTGGVLLDLDRADEAETTLKRALQLQEADPIAHAYYGRLLSTMKGDTQQAVDHLKRAVNAMPKNGDMRYQLGLVYERGQLLGDAADAFKSAIAIDDSNLDAHQHLGQVMSSQAQFSSAIAQFEKVLAKDPKRPGALGDLADAQFKSGDVDAAVKNFRKAIEMSPKQGGLQYKLGRAYDKKGMTSEATQAYETATKIEPSNPLPWYYLGYVYKGRGKNKDAVAAFQNYLKYAKDAKDADEINDEINFLKDAK